MNVTNLSCSKISHCSPQGTSPTEPRNAPGPYSVLRRLVEELGWQKTVMLVVDRKVGSGGGSDSCTSYLPFVFKIAKYLG